MPQRAFPPGRPALILAVLAGSVGACAPDRVVTGSAYPHEVRERHPVVLAEAPRTLDVFVGGGGKIGLRQREDLRTFAAEYRQAGRGPIVAHVPRGEANATWALEGIRSAMAESGLDAAHLVVSSYPPVDPAIASPIRLTFQRMQAKVAGRCGLWPQDLGGSDSKFNASNAPYWNFGCAAQSNFAAQVADPIDLVRGRSETPGDAQRRTKDIQDLREGKDPSTQYRQDGQGKINQAVGN
jgi:pilus assembly protein CpaD